MYTKRNNKIGGGKVARKIARRMMIIGGASIFSTSFILPIATPTLTMAAETNELDNAIDKAKNTANLDVNVTKETITVKKDEAEAKRKEIEALEKAEANKLNEAVKQQEANNKDYEDKANDYNYLLKNEVEGYSKEQIKELLTDSNGDFNFSDVHILDLDKADDVEISVARPVEIKEKLKDVLTHGVVGHPTVGDYVLYSNVFSDIRSGKDIDVKISIQSINDINADDAYVGYDLGLIKKDGVWHQNEKHTYGNSSSMVVNNNKDENNINVIYSSDVTNEKGGYRRIDYEMEFLEHGTDNKVPVDILFSINDLDKYETYTSKTDVFKYAKPSDVKVGSEEHQEGTVKIDGNKFIGTVDGNTALNQSVLLLYRNVDTININWGNAHLDLDGINIEFNIPELKTTQVDITEYELVIEPYDEKAVFHFVDDKGATIKPDIEKNGKDNEKFTVDDVTNVIKELKDNGYDITKDPVTGKTFVYDENPDIDQEYTVVAKPIIETITPDNAKKQGESTTAKNVKYPKGLDKDSLQKELTRTVYFKYQGENGEDIFEPVVQKVTVSRTATFNYVTGEVTYSDWSTAAFDKIDSPIKENYVYDKSTISSTNATENVVEYVIYNKIPQKGTVTFTDGTTDIADKVELNGYNDEPIDYSPNDTIKELENKGYDVISNDFPDDAKFDKDEEVDQNFVVNFNPHIEVITPDNPKISGEKTGRGEIVYPEGVAKEDLTKTVTRIIKYLYPDGTQAADPIIQEVTLTREATFNYVTGEVTYSDWSVATVDGAESPEIAGFIADKGNIEGMEINAETGDIEEIVTYTAIPVESEENTIPEIENFEVPTDESLMPTETPTETPVIIPDTVNTPNTGDKNNTGIFATIIAGAGAGIAAAITFIKKRKTQ